MKQEKVPPQGGNSRIDFYFNNQLLSAAPSSITLKVGDVINISNVIYTVQAINYVLDAPTAPYTDRLMRARVNLVKGGTTAWDLV